IRSETHAGVAFEDRAAVAAPAEAVLLAFRLRTCPASHGSRVVLFVPASRDVGTEHVVTDALAGLLQLNEQPVLMRGLRPPDGATAEPPVPPADTFDLPYDIAFRDRTVPPSDVPFTLVHPFAGLGDPVRYAASAEFAGVIDRARSSYPYIL